MRPIGSRCARCGLADERRPQTPRSRECAWRRACSFGCLVALVGVGAIAASAGPIDARLMLESDSDGWAYAIAGPSDLVCFGVITDAQSLKGTKPRFFMSGMLSRTGRIARLMERLTKPLAIKAMPVPCRWLPLKADARSIRIGDAQATRDDPLTGRGLWEAICKSEEVATALDEDADKLERIERTSKAAYQAYLARRFPTFIARVTTDLERAFWSRRCSSESNYERNSQRALA